MRNQTPFSSAPTTFLRPDRVHQRDEAPSSEMVDDPGFGFPLPDPEVGCLAVEVSGAVGTLDHQRLTEQQSKATDPPMVVYLADQNARSRRVG